MTKKCQKCGQYIDDEDIYCRYCGAHWEPTVISTKPNVLYGQSSTTTMSGQVYTVGPSDYLSPSFSKIGKHYDDQINKGVSVNAFQEKGIDIKTLDDYEKRGYLKKLSDGKYALTEDGKKIYLKNKEFRQEIENYADQIEFGNGLD